MNADRIEGHGKQIKGKLMQLWAGLTGDAALSRRGHAIELVGSAQAGFGRAMGMARAHLGFRRRLGV
ncbi:hypothetical protein GCM10008170_19570 [Methylopila capsulata]|uniref:CsbD family protein n=1 Tax=Methylopila capsulata TaxID=61654 RepID=A0A9W6ISZ3_9HYPH|nr:hypothetical protein GCM10008170_19570 [Methylopila capsulata]